MALVGESDRVDGAVGSIGVDKYVLAALGEFAPLKIRRHSLGCTKHVCEELLILLCLSANELVEGHHGLLNDFNDVGFKLREVVLDRNQIVAVIVLFKDLLIESVVDLSVDNVWIISCAHLSTTGSVVGGLLAEKFDVLLGSVSCLIDFLRALDGSR